MASLIDPTDINLEYAPQRRRDVTEVEVDGEAVIYEPDGKGVHKLNRVATVLWNCFDGSATLRELSEDLEEVFGEESERVRADVLAYTRELGEEGLLVGVRRVESHERSSSGEPNGESES